MPSPPHNTMVPALTGLMQVQQLTRLSQPNSCTTQQRAKRRCPGTAWLGETFATVHKGTRTNTRLPYRISGPALRPVRNDSQPAMRSELRDCHANAGGGYFLFPHAMFGPSAALLPKFDFLGLLIVTIMEK
jgi:hypothetical protein